MKFKSFLILLMVALFLFVFSSCTFSHVQEHGLENFNINDSELGLCAFLFPENFLEKFDYIDSDYFYDDFLKLYFFDDEHIDKVLVYGVYNEKTYFEAKKYLQSNLSLINEPIGVAGNYIFYKNTEINVHYDKAIYDKHHFTAVAFNDTNNTIAFIGLYIAPRHYDYTEYDALYDNWPEFIEYYYGEFYDFNK